jgi:hypothetical protein
MPIKAFIWQRNKILILSHMKLILAQIENKADFDQETNLKNYQQWNRKHHNTATSTISHGSYTFSFPQKI